jgi:hypothetical protein
MGITGLGGEGVRKYMQGSWAGGKSFSWLHWTLLRGAEPKAAGNIFHDSKNIL